MTFALRRGLWVSAATGGKPPSFDFTFTATGADTLTLQRVTPTGGTCTVTWGDGTSTVIADGNEAATTHTYAGAGAYPVTIYNSQRITWFEARSDAKIGGDISGWVLPANLTIFYVYSTYVEGDISGWVLPANLTHFYVYSTSVSGDISGWVLPANLTHFGVSSTSVSGDISGWTLPASLARFYVDSTSVSGAPDCTGAIKLTEFQYQNCGLNQTTVDAILWSLYQAAVAPRTGTGGTINVGGTNAAPTGVFQAAGACPVTVATDGKEIAHELLNDGCAAGFNKWATVTITA